jgi:hypothetical protein
MRLILKKYIDLIKGQTVPSDICTLPAIDLYKNQTYRLLKEKFGAANVYILGSYKVVVHNTIAPILILA